VQPGDYVQIIVRDTGVGMVEATRIRMFEPFFTTKAKGKGTGLGLSSVWGIVKQSGGYIHVNSTPGAGTTIELLLPRAAATSAKEPGKRAVDHQVPGSETILLVDDEAAVLEFARTALERQGYRVLTASGSEDAMRIAHDFRERISLLLTDVRMPGMQGPELATRLRSMRPGLRVLFMSGYAAEAVTSETLKETALLQKPFKPAVLSRAVRLVLDQRA
jgi:CheY-like chemotaxis protein